MNIIIQPINRAVTEQWHKEHCIDMDYQMHSDKRHLICSTCGKFVQIPQTKEQMKCTSLER